MRSQLFHLKPSEANCNSQSGFRRFSQQIPNDGGTNQYDSARAIQFGSINSLASANYHGHQASMYLEHGKTIHRGKFRIQPMGALQYGYVHQSGFDETGAGVLNLQVDADDTYSLRSILGGKISSEFQSRRGMIVKPEIHANWMHEYLNSSSVVNSRLGALGTGASFPSQGLDLGSDWALVGFRFHFTPVNNQNVSLFASYDAQVNDRQTFHMGSGGIEFAW